MGHCLLACFYCLDLRKRETEIVASQGVEVDSSRFDDGSVDVVSLFFYNINHGSEGGERRGGGEGG